MWKNLFKFCFKERIFLSIICIEIIEAIYSADRSYCSGIFLVYFRSKIKHFTSCSTIIWMWSYFELFSIFEYFSDISIENTRLPCCRKIISTFITSFLTINREIISPIITVSCPSSVIGICFHEYTEGFCSCYISVWTSLHARRFCIDESSICSSFYSPTHPISI